MSGWEGFRDERLTLGLEVPGMDLRHVPGVPLCPAARGGYNCSRDADHAGRHLATIRRTRVVAAWPGHGRPTAADLESVPS